MKGSLQVKGGKYYAVIAYKDEFGKEKRKWVSTGLEEKGNKRKAEVKLNEIIQEFMSDESSLSVKSNQKSESDALFSDYLKQWLLSIKNKIEEITYKSYSRNTEVLVRYFHSKKIALKNLKPYDLQEFYNNLYKRGRGGNTAIHYHVLIRMALKEAVRLDLIEKNVADLIDRPKKEKYEASFYNKEELRNLFEVIKDDPLELVINITAYYGLRRSEVLGLKWSAIDFENKMIKINHKVVEVDGKLIGKNKMKNKTSNRTLPLIPQIKNMLIKEKQKQLKNKELCGKGYNTKYLDYVCVNSLGELLKPNYLTQHFRILQDNNKLKHIRFHDLRHSCASLMLSSGVPMKQIQEWLGHSTFQTTADIYAHLDYSTKISSAQAISTALTFEKSKNKKNEDESENFNEQTLTDEIKELERMLEEKRKKRKQMDSEM